MKSHLLLLCASLYCAYAARSQEVCFQNNIINQGNVIGSYWPMDADGNDIISPLNNPQGTLGAGVTFTGTPFTGSAAASFAGTGGIQYSDGTFMNTLITSLSFGAWIKPSTLTPASPQIIFEEGGTNGISVFLNIIGEIVFVVADGSQANSDDIRFTFPVDGQYHHIAFNYNGRLEIFLDGRLHQVVNTGFGTIAAHTDAGGLGATFGTSSAARTRFPSTTFQSFNGLIDEAYYTPNMVSHGNLMQYGRCHGKNIYTNLGCNPDAFMVQDANSVWISINLVTGRSNPSSGAIDDGYAPAGTSVNGIGYNTLDGTLYGIDCQTGYIMQIELTTLPTGYTYQSRRVAFISQLAGLNIITGDVSNGRLYLREGGIVSRHFIVDVNPSSPTYLQLLSTVSESGSFEFYDWAYNPMDGLLYTVSLANGNLLSVDPATGTIVNLGSAGLGTNQTYGACYFDSQGFLYVYNNTTGNIYRIDVDGASKHGVLFSSARSGLDLNDGARCADAPFPIDFGDAPDISTPTLGAGTGTAQYNTMLSNNGPRHGVSSFIPLRMGATVTLENDGKPQPNAALDTDDGISSFPAIFGGMSQPIPSYTVSAVVTNQNTTTAATLYAWIDWNCDGTFAVGERISVPVAANTTNGTVSLTWSNMILTGPNGTAGTYARFRLSTDANAQNPGGVAADGEVEDYYIPFDYVLPVQLISFTAIVAGQQVNIEWSTATEDKVGHFELERSSNGREYSRVATITARGNNSKYDYIDSSPFAGINYYRLKMVDRDGSFAFSPVRLVNLGDNGSLVLYPNPARDNIGILFNQDWPKGVTRISLLSADGRGLILKSINLQGGGSMGLDISKIPSGIYFLQLQASTKQVIKKIQVIK